MSDVFAVGKTSRLYKRLVYDDQIATNARAYVNLREIGGLFYFDATVRTGGNAGLVEAALTEELDRLLLDGVTEAELRRIKTNYRASVVRSAERVGGFGGKSDILTQGEVYGTSADDYRRQLDWVETATADDLRDAARHWLSDGAYILTVLPYNDGATTPATVDRSTGVPPVGDSPSVSFPPLQTTTLSNGLEVNPRRAPSHPNREPQPPA